MSHHNSVQSRSLAEIGATLFVSDPHSKMSDPTAVLLPVQRMPHSSGSLRNSFSHICCAPFRNSNLQATLAQHRGALHETFWHNTKTLKASVECSSMIEMILSAIERFEMKRPLGIMSLAGGRAPTPTTTTKTNCTLPSKVKPRKRHELVASVCAVKRTLSRSNKPTAQKSSEVAAPKDVVANGTDAVPNAPSSVNPAEHSSTTTCTRTKIHLSEVPAARRFSNKVCQPLPRYTPPTYQPRTGCQSEESTHTIVASSTLSPAESHIFFAKVPVTLAASPISNYETKRAPCTRPRRGSLLSRMISESEDEEQNSPWMAMVERRRRILREKRRMETDEEDPLVPMPLDEYEALTDGEGVSPILGCRLPPLFKCALSHLESDSNVSNSLIDPAWRIREMQRMHVCLAEEQTRMRMTRKRGYHQAPIVVVDQDDDLHTHSDVYEPEPVLW